MISALEAYKRSLRKISSESLKQLEEIEKEILLRLDYNNIDNYGDSCCFYETDSLRPEVRVLLKNLGYKVSGDGCGCEHKYRYRIDWKDVVKPKSKNNSIYWRELL